MRFAGAWIAVSFVLLSACTAPSEGANGEDREGQTSTDFGPEDVVAGLADEGVEARLAPWRFSRFTFLPKVAEFHVVCLPSGQASLYEYDTAELREADSDLILPDGGFKDGHFDLEYGRTMWWAKGRVIIRYSFANPDYWNALTAVLGETLSPDGEFFGDPPNPLPPSEPCL